MSYRAITPPLYHTLSGLQGIIDATKMRTNITTEAGVVFSTGAVDSVTTILPGPVRTFNDQGLGTAVLSLVTVNGINVLDFQGDRWLRSTASAATWDFFSHNATFANMRWTITIMMRPGYGASPGNFNCIIGTNGGSSGAKGFGIWHEDRDAVSTNALTHNMTRGVGGSFISNSQDASQITPNSWDIYRFTFDGSLAAGSRFKAYKNKVQLTTTVSSNSTATVTTPTNTLEIGNSGGGGNSGGFIGQMSHVILQSVVESTVVADAFEDSLQEIRTALNNHQTPTCHPYNFVTGDLTRYFIGVVMSKDPTAAGVISRTYREGTNHLLTADSEVKNQISTDYGVTWGTPSVVLTTGGAAGPNMGGFAGGYDSNGRLWMIGEKRTVGAANQLPFEAWVFYSDDNGANWTFVDITSVIPSDGLDMFIFYGRLIQTSTGRLACTFYKQNVAATSSAIYALVSDNGGTTWVPKTIRAAGVGYQNETDLAVCGSRIIAYSRDETTKEFHVRYSDDDLETWTDDGAETLGETWTNAGPLVFSQFDLYGVNVTALWTCDRLDSPTARFMGIFARTSTLTSNAHGFDLDTKTILRARVVHYGMVVHPFGDFHAIGSFAEEPITSPYNEDNRLVAFYVGDQAKSLVCEQLGITRI